MGARQIRQFLAMVYAVESGGDSGVLDVRTSAERALIYFRDGQIVFVEQSSLGKTVGAYLVDQGVVTRLQYQTIVASLGQDKPESPLMTFMERAIRDRIIDPAMASAILAAQVERNFIRCLGWEPEYSQFLPEASVLEGKPVFPCSLPVLTLQGLRTHLSEEDTGEALRRYIGRHPAFIKSVDSLAREYRLNARDERYLRQLDESSPFAGPDDLDSSSRTLLVTLVFSGRLRFVSDDASSSGQHAVITVADAPNVRNVRFTLPTPPSAEEVEAATSYQRGKTKLGDDPVAACTELRRAAKLVSRPDYRLYAVWAEYLIADEATQKTLLPELEDATRAALENDSTFSFAYFVVGKLHLAYGDHESATLAFERSAALDPRNEHAVRALNALRDQSDTA